MNNRILLSCTIIMLTILTIPTVSAHGGESTDGLTNLQILLISVGIAASTYFLIMRFLEFKINHTSRLLFPLVAFTGAVHVLLGLSDNLLLLGGIGVIGIIALSLIVDFTQSQEKIAMFGLGLVVVTMFIAYFVSNHDLHYIAEDYLGIITKLVEITIIILLYKQVKQSSTKSQG